MSGVEEVLAAHGSIGYDDVDGCDCGADVRTHAAHRAHVAGQLQRLIRQAQAEAVAEVARAWQINGWADVLLPAPKPPAVPAIAYAQRVIDWLRDRANRLAGDA